MVVALAIDITLLQHQTVRTRPPGESATQSKLHLRCWATPRPSAGTHMSTLKFLKHSSMDGCMTRGEARDAVSGSRALNPPSTVSSTTPDSGREVEVRVAVPEHGLPPRCVG